MLFNQDAAGDPYSLALFDRTFPPMQLTRALVNFSPEKSSLKPDRKLAHSLLTSLIAISGLASCYLTYPKI